VAVRCTGGERTRYLQLNYWFVGILCLTSCFVRHWTSPCFKNTEYLFMVYVYLLSMAGLFLQLNTRVSFQTEGLQIHKYLSFLHRLQNILPFHFLYIYISNLAERPVCRNVAEEGNIFQDDTSPLATVCERRLRAPYSSKEKIVENLTRRKIISVPRTTRSASRTWWFVVVSLRSQFISMHFFLCKELNLLGTGQERWQPKCFAQKCIPIVLGRAVLRIESLLYCRNQFSTSILCKCSLQ